MNGIDIKEFKNKIRNDIKLTGGIYIEEFTREVSLIGDQYHEINEEVLDFLYVSIKTDAVKMIKKESKIK